MFEKLKDVLYEASDILLAFVILLVMSSVITWQVNFSMASGITQEINASTIAEQPKDEDKNMVSVPPASESPEASATPDTNTLNETAATEPAVEDTPSTETDKEVPVIITPSPEIIKVEIPSGTHGAGIAKILKEKGLVDDSSAFIARVEELKLASKLKSGKFDIKSDASLDDIIYTITGQKR